MALRELSCSSGGWSDESDFDDDDYLNYNEEKISNKKNKNKKKMKNNKKEENENKNKKMIHRFEIGNLSAHEELMKSLMEMSRNDKVELKFSEFLGLLKESAGKDAPSKVAYVQSLKIVGEALDDSSALDCTLKIVILSNKWVSLPLFPSSVALVNLSSISFDPISSFSDSNESNDLKSPSAGCSVGVLGDWYCLISSGAGHYEVGMEILVPFSTPMKTGFTMKLPRAACNTIRFTVPEPHFFVKVDPSLFSSPLSEEEADSKSGVTCRFPPTNRLSVQWTEDTSSMTTKGPLIPVPEPERSDKTEATVATAHVDSFNLVSIGEGILSCNSLFKYSIRGGQIACFQLAISPIVKVLHISGTSEFPVKRWEVLDKKGKKKKKKDRKVLKVWLEYGLDEAYEFTVQSEVEMKGTSCHVNIPLFDAMVQKKEVIRQSGHVAVEALANVEIAQMEKPPFLSQIDPSQTPRDLRQLASNPIVLAYKYLQQQHDDQPELQLRDQVKLAIQTHEDCEVLIATILSCHLTMTYSEDGKVVHGAVFLVRNTQQQYLRCSIPEENYEIWSTSIEGSPVKPALDGEGNILIPLRQSQSAPFAVELIYMLPEEDSMTSSRGDLNFRFLKVDLPINHLFATLYLPDNYRYGDFTGSIEEVDYFSETPPSCTSSSSSLDQTWNAMPQQQQAMQITNVAHNPIFMAGKQEQRREEGKGLMPVRVEVPTTNTYFYFESLLVTSQFLELVGEFKKISKGCCRRRRLGSKLFCCCG